ncbi:outer membrane lipoprotein-sorting protein [Fodinibius halophilus]|uniref:Outer membrane lipoprotein-sorting protein n=1 Tax=Fodinibius halophilus TaxID=1736908 RepID=A0A6M1T5W7_9BACT|nr:outer membrane lipoprotein-sorting protein [Fodinibius halophilus]NGP89459.1 outer membrane lipoprotein-sorting protein [Fodinibius halophilus]
MQFIQKYCFVISVLLFSGVTMLQAQDATDIVQKADKKMRGESSRAKITMKIVRPSWQREVTMKAWSLGTDYSLILVTAPARDEGTAYLKRENEIWNWLPNINRTIKMPPSMMSQSWMGSDFSNNDLVEESSIVTDYNHTMAGDSTISDYKCYKIEMTPKPQAPVVWGKLISFISKQEYLQLRTEFYNEDGKLIKVMEGSRIKNMNGRTIPTKMEMIPMNKKDQKTVLLYEDIAFNTDIDERFFSIQNMKRVD